MCKWNEYRRRLGWCEAKNVARLAKYLNIEFPSHYYRIPREGEGHFAVVQCDGTCKECKAILIERLVRHDQLNLPEAGRTFEK
jgi:hypothetical protein